MEIICPQPWLWDAIYRRLRIAAERADPPIPLPPKPLILAGWAYSNDREKQERWENTVEWAQRYAKENLIGDLPLDQMYQVESPTEYIVGPMGGPMYLPWDFTPKKKLSREDSESFLAKLTNSWDDIAGPELSEITRPLRFTGAKCRRLVVLAEEKAVPPWGSWKHLPRDESGRSFTRLRRAVNEAISPHMVDHIAFVHRP